jgi:Sortase domain
MSTHARRGRYLAVAGVVLAVAGLLALSSGLHGQQRAPRPPASAAVPVDPTDPTGAPAGTAPAPAAAIRHLVLPASTPTRLSIPAIGVTSELRPLGLNPDRTVQVPPLGRDSYAGWYKYSPSPGQLGPSVILGHIDSARNGPGVFFKLGALRPRDTVTVTRADHTVAVFRVERVVEYAKAHFPTAEVYGNTDRAALRLITCGGRFDPSALSYQDNIVAYASLVSSHHA